MPELREITFEIGEKEYKMREMLGERESFFRNELTDASGKVNEAELWFRRLNLTMLSPLFDRDIYNKCTFKELESLKTRWIFLNQIDPRDFLDPLEAKGASTS